MKQIACQRACNSYCPVIKLIESNNCTAGNFVLYTMRFANNISFTNCWLIRASVCLGRNLDLMKMNYKSNVIFEISPLFYVICEIQRGDQCNTLKIEIPTTCLKC